MSVRHVVIIRQYRIFKGQNPDTWIQHCQNQNNLVDAIHFAALSINMNGKKHPHQYRLQRRHLRSLERNLLRSQIQISNAQDFDMLYRIVEGCRTKGIGDLAIYDTAVRIGAYLGLIPRRIYLHAGTKVGAKKLIGNITSNTLTKNQLPEPFRSSNLSCYELEDLLCIYKNSL